MRVERLSDGTKRSVLEHREVMEAHLGRKLESWECVHHRDGNRANNALGNLEVISRGDHAREHARSEELVVFACPECGGQGTKPARVVRSNRKQGKAGPFCSKSCSGKWSRRRQVYSCGARPRAQFLAQVP